MNGAPTSLRVREMDAIRGAAMIAVCASHSASLVSATDGPWAIRLVILGMIATPTFLLLSGVVCGYLSAAMPESDTEFRWRMIDRGLFLLVVGHLVLGLTHATWIAPRVAFWRCFYITDAVAVGLIVAGFCARRLRCGTLLLSGFMLFVIATIASNMILHGGHFERSMARLFIGLGAAGDQDEGYLVPIVPYLGIFLIGIAGGKQFAMRRARGQAMLSVAWFCIWSGLLCIALAIALKLTGIAIKPLLSEAWQKILFRLVTPTQKIPPGPSYLLAFGGAGMVLAGGVAMAFHYQRAMRLISALAIIGRASLVTYVAQYWVYYVPAFCLHAHNLQGWWFIWFPTSLLFLWLVAWRWDQARYNRFLTLGLRRRFETLTTSQPAIGRFQ